MRWRRLLFPPLLLFCPLAMTVASACGSDVAYRSDTGTGGNGGTFMFVDGGGTGGSRPDATPVQDAFSEYVDPGCPDSGGPIYDFQCDPYDQDSGECEPDEGCYIYVSYPSEECGQEIYGSYCAPAGVGEQGDSCWGGLDCAPGFVCVVTGCGVQCVQLCRLSGEDGCPPGFVCEPIDVEGFGGCL